MALPSREVGSMSARVGLVLAVLCVLAPGWVQAAELRSGQVVTVGPQEVIDDDLYAFGQTVTIQGTVRGDVVAFGRTVDVTGAVAGDVLAAAAELRVSSLVQGSVRAAAGTLVVSGPVNRDVVLAGNRLQLEPSARVRGDALLAGNDIQLRSPVGGEVRAGADALTVAAPVRGDVHAEVRALRLSPEARIGGDLSYRAQEALLNPNAVVAGNVQRFAVEERGMSPVVAVLWSWGRSLVGLFALGLLLVLLSPSLARRAPATLRESPWLSLAWGAVFFFGLPLVAAGVFFLGLLLGGWWIGLFALGVYLLAIALCFPVVGLLVGRWLLERFGKRGAHLVVALLVGLALLTLLSQVPILGALVVVASVIFGLGALAIAAARGRRRPAEVPV
jgi:cytoskeletal protein CcmA (bactofilin family)